jgi:hypothetical protein
MTKSHITLTEPLCVLKHLAAVGGMFDVGLNRRGIKLTPDGKFTLYIQPSIMAALHPHVTTYLDEIVRPDAEGVEGLRQLNAFFGEHHARAQAERT